MKATQVIASKMTVLHPVLAGNVRLWSDGNESYPKNELYNAIFNMFRDIFIKEIMSCKCLVTIL